MQVALQIPYRLIWMSHAEKSIDMVGNNCISILRLYPFCWEICPIDLRALNFQSTVLESGVRGLRCKCMERKL